MELLDENQGRSIGKKLKGMLDQKLGENIPGPAHYQSNPESKPILGGTIGGRP
jgi:hypothetical protein